MSANWPMPSATEQISDGVPLAGWWFRWFNTLWSRIGKLTFPSSGTIATTSNKLSDFAATTSAELATVISDETGADKLLFGKAWAAFTVTRTGWTDVGAPTVTGRFCQIGNVVHFQVKVVPATTTATAAGTSYIALPATAAGIAGEGSMMNITTLVGIGGCAIDVPNSRCYVPTQGPVGNTLTIAGWYEV